MADIAAVRVELKTWEREFKSQHGRDPSVQDIKAHPEIAQRYKLYKRLNKAAPAAFPPVSPQQVGSGEPSTPPRTKQAASKPAPGPSNANHRLFDKPRAVAVDAPVSSSNPFSPAKRSRRSPSAAPTQAGLFSPAKRPRAALVAGGSRQSHGRSPSPNPFSEDVLPSITPTDIMPSLTSAMLATQSGVAPDLIRARKRLRGEPVSPSPSKDKRRRIVPRSSGVFSKLDFSRPLGADDDEAFIEDSPMKAPQTEARKNFELLFEEDAIQSPNFFGKGDTMKRSSSAASSNTCSPDDTSSIGGDEPPTTDHEDELDFGKSDAGPFTSSPLVAGRPRKNIMPRGSAYKSDNLLDDDPPEGSLSSRPQVSETMSRVPSSRKSTSGHAAIADDDTSDVASSRPSLHNGPTLLPPSPRANGKSYQPKYAKGKIKASASAGGKGKQKASMMKKQQQQQPGPGGDLDDGTDHADASSGADDHDSTPVRVYDWNASRRALMEVGDMSVASDFDPEFDFALARKHRVIIDPLDDDMGEGKVEISIPDHLKSVLALPPSASQTHDHAQYRDHEVDDDTDIAALDSYSNLRTRRTTSTAVRSNRRNEALVQAVISGSRFGHHDSARGAEVWDAGEVSDGDGLEVVDRAVGAGFEEDDDDWEGEGKPWEAGDL